jgi:hypothetical protein
MKALLILFFPFVIFAQESQIRFKLTFKEQEIDIGKSYLFENRDVNIDNLKFYISNLKIIRKNKIVFQDSLPARLVDIENKSSLSINLKHKKKFDKIIFNLGIDSLINVSGAYGGDLDPTNGMYWTWQSGYINFKLEGTDPLCKSRHHKFQYHLGGYAAPYNSLQQISLNLDKKSTRAEIRLPIDTFLKAVNPQNQSEIMSPGSRAVELSAILKQLFVVKSW